MCTCLILLTCVMISERMCTQNLWIKLYRLDEIRLHRCISTPPKCANLGLPDDARWLMSNEKSPDFTSFLPSNARKFPSIGNFSMSNVAVSGAFPINKLFSFQTLGPWDMFIIPSFHPWQGSHWKLLQTRHCRHLDPRYMCFTWWKQRFGKVG